MDKIDEIRAEMSTIIAKIQAGVTAQKKTAQGLKFEYRDAESIIRVIKPYIELYKIEFQYSQVEIFPICVEKITSKKKDEDGSIVIHTKENNRLFLKTQIIAIYKGVKSDPFYTFTDITTQTVGGGITNSSQVFGSHDSYAKKRAYASFFLMTSDVDNLDPDKLS